MWFKNLLHGKPKAPATALLLLQRDPTTLSQERVLPVAERAWGRTFPGGDSTWFVLYTEASRSVWVGLDGRVVNIFHATAQELDEDKATEKLPPVAERQSWPAYTERLEVRFSSDVTPPDACFALVAKLAVGLIDTNCVGIYDCFHQTLLPNTPETIAWLHTVAATAPSIT